MPCVAGFTMFTAKQIQFYQIPAFLGNVRAIILLLCCQTPPLPMTCNPSKPPLIDTPIVKHLTNVTPVSTFAFMFENYMFGISAKM